ncbi:MAG: hypothetical protein ABIO99_08520, partial [Candidatus Limnocylindria bacterium]
MTMILAVAARYVLFAGLLIGVTVWWFIVARWRVRDGQAPLPRYPTWVAAGFATLLLLIGVGGSLLSVTSFKQTAALPEPSSTGGPNIYVLHLDGYPRQDTLERDYAFDNSPLVEQLAEMPCGGRSRAVEL